MTHCAGPRWPIQFYSNEPRGAVKSKRVGRKVNRDGLQFPRRAFQSRHHIVKGACDIAHSIHLRHFSQKLPRNSGRKEWGKQYAKEQARRERRRAYKRKKVACWGAASLLMAIRVELCLVCGLGATIWEDYQRCRSQTVQLTFLPSYLLKNKGAVID